MMTNRNKLSQMTNIELSSLLCLKIMPQIGDKAEANGFKAPDYELKPTECILCPVRDYCSEGKNGFIAWLEKEAKEIKLEADGEL